MVVAVARGLSRAARGFVRGPMVVAVAVSTLVCVPGADALQGTRGGLGFEVFPYAGMSHNEREARLPMSPLAGVRLTGNIWAPEGALVRVATFLGGSGNVIAVNEAVPCTADPCPGGTDLLIDYLVTLEAGLKTDLPGEPYVVGFIGRGYPEGDAGGGGTDPGAGAGAGAGRAGGGPVRTYGAGLGISPILGRTALRVEVRYRRDDRFAEHMDESVEILLGLPGW